MATTLLLARHGETDWNRERRWQGQADPGLNDAGQEPARELARALAATPLDAVYSSDLDRARETAVVVAAEHGLDVIARPDLREIDIGEWSGLTTAEIEQRYPDGWARHSGGGDGWEQGETHARMSVRFIDAAIEIALVHPAGHVLLVLHGGVIRALLARAAGIELGEYRRRRSGHAETSHPSLRNERCFTGEPDELGAHLRPRGRILDSLRAYAVKGDVERVERVGGLVDEGCETL